MIRLKTRNKPSFPRSRVIESTLVVVEPEQALATTAPAQQYHRWRFRRRLHLCLLLVAACVFSLTVVGYTFLWSRATIRIVAATTVRAATVPVQASIHPGSDEGRLVQYQAHASSPFVPVRATGIQHIAATAASGSLTWFNQHSYPQTISAAGTSIAISPTIQIAPDQDVVVPPSSGSSPGEASAPAHALQAGEAGNIAPGTINMLCGCGAAQGVLVKNLAGFSGGQDTTTRSFIQPSDLTQAVVSQQVPTLRHAQQLLLAQVQLPEQVAGENACTSRTITDRPLTATAQVRASITETCTVFAFNPDEARTKAIALYLRSASAPGPHQVLNTVSASRRVQVAAGTSAQAALVLTVHVTAQWRYVMGKVEQEKLLGLLAGKTPEEAAQVLAHYTGVGAFSISQLVPWLALPGDPERIAIQYENPPGPREP
jgi:hypothetical protein